MRTAAKVQAILLTGPKHSGKTSTGRVLAQYGGRDFIDLDELIERQNGTSPRNLYTQSPERFRKAEAEALKSLIHPQHEPSSFKVIAAGGGIIDNADAMALVEAADLLIIYLDVSVETAWKRICQETGPLPPFLNTDNPRETHAKLHQRRAAAYKSRAHMKIHAEAKGLEQIVEEIITALDRFLGPYAYVQTPLHT
ncbi:MAG: shikimate kinase [Treponema sp.]|jgi:shikimate kinase|nr:shikimate kinase [Treponema sp.]